MPAGQVEQLVAPLVVYLPKGQWLQEAASLAVLYWPDWHGQQPPVLPMYRPAPQPTHFSIPQPAVSEHAAASLCLPRGHAVHAPALALALPLPMPPLLLYMDA